MSIASEITRLQGAKADLATAIEGKGVTVPSATKLDGYADLVDAISQGGGGGTMQSKSVSYTPTTSAQSQTVTADAGYDGLSSVAVSVAAMPSGTEGTPTVTKGTVSNHSIAVTPSVTNSAGYIEGGTKTGEAVTVSASDVTSGYQIKTANGTYDVTNLASLIVTVPNTYSASDEGKVVDNGALVSQTSTTFTENGTYDTTTNDEVVVNVSGGGGSLQDFLTLAINYQLDSEGEDIVLTKSGTAGVVDMNSLLRKANLKKVTVNNITQLAPWFFGGSTITEVVFDDKYVNFSDSIFRDCTSLVKAILPSVAKTYINYSNAQNEFNGCTNLSVLHCPNLESGQPGMFRGCSSLPYFDAITSPISTNMFYGCSVLNVLILRKSDSIATLSNVNAFTNTPFASGGTGGTLYVPSALISSYQSATNWSTILGYANNQIKSIESTHTDPTAPIDLTLYYADGTPISA